MLNYGGFGRPGKAMFIGNHLQFAAHSLQQFPGPEKKGRICRAAIFFIPRGKGFKQQDSAFGHRIHKLWKKRTPQIIGNYNGVKTAPFQRPWRPVFQLNLKAGHPIQFCNRPDIAINSSNPAAKLLKKNRMASLATSQIKHIPAISDERGKAANPG